MAIAALKVTASIPAGTGEDQGRAGARIVLEGAVDATMRPQGAAQAPANASKQERAPRRATPARSAPS